MSTFEIFPHLPKTLALRCTVYNSAKIFCHLDGLNYVQQQNILKSGILGMYSDIRVVSCIIDAFFSLVEPWKTTMHTTPKWSATIANECFFCCDILWPLQHNILMLHILLMSLTLLTSFTSHTSLKHFLFFLTSSYNHSLFSALLPARLHATLLSKGCDSNFISPSFV